LAVTPAHGSGEAFLKITAVVVPIPKLSTEPTGRQTSGTFSKRGDNRKPTTGMPIIAAAIPLKPMLNLSRNRRRLNVSDL
jgi:hypothetical protein